MSVKKGPKFVLEKVQNLKCPPPPWRFDKNIPVLLWIKRVSVKKEAFLLREILIDRPIAIGLF